MVVSVWKRRSVRVAMALVGLSVAYWVAVWAWTQAEAARQAQAGANEIALTLHANGFVYEATWAYVAGLLVLHTTLLALMGWRKDREAALGVSWSFGLHLLFLVLSGIVGPPS